MKNSIKITFLMCKRETIGLKTCFAQLTLISLRDETTKTQTNKSIISNVQ